MILMDNVLFERYFVQTFWNDLMGDTSLERFCTRSQIQSVLQLQYKGHNCDVMAHFEWAKDPATKGT